jgi:hypothetical protein
MRVQSQPVPTSGDHLARRQGALIKNTFEVKMSEATTAVGASTVDEQLLWTVQHAMYWFSNVSLELRWII